MDTNILGTIFGVLSSTLRIYSFLLLIRVLLTWFPSIDWNNNILSALCSITDPYLNIFRGVIPPIGGFDISSILAFLLLNFLQGELYSLSFI
jgi:YggT family protein